MQSTIDQKREAQETANDVFMSRKIEIDALIEKLRIASDDHFGANPDTLNWGDAGQLGHALTQLTDLVRFLGIA